MQQVSHARVDAGRGSRIKLASAVSSLWLSIDWIFRIAIIGKLFIELPRSFAHNFTQSQEKWNVLKIRQLRNYCTIKNSGTYSDKNR